MLDAGRAVHRADAGKVRAFIRSFGTLGKTDRIDAPRSPSTAVSATPGWRFGNRSMPSVTGGIGW